jgi:hypothetical protein
MKRSVASPSIVDLLLARGLDFCGRPVRGGPVCHRREAMKMERMQQVAQAMVEFAVAGGILGAGLVAFAVLG